MFKMGIIVINVHHPDFPRSCHLLIEIDMLNITIAILIIMEVKDIGKLNNEVLLSTPTVKVF